jgi:mono/diheme cytochrome c family protein
MKRVSRLYSTLAKIQAGSRSSVLILCLAALLFLAACNDMSDQAKYEPLEANLFFPDRRASRPLPEGVVPRRDPGLGSGAAENEAEYNPRSEAGELLDSFPFAVTLEVLERGQERYNIFCAPCHGLDGAGQGMIVQRGFPPPPSLHDERLRQAPAGYYYEVIRDGFGQMYSYAYRVKSPDRWAITAYIRALQLSQNATLEEVPAEEQERLQPQP